MAESFVITVPGAMRGKGRPVFSRRGNFVAVHTDAKTVSAENWVRSCAVEQVGNPCLSGALCVWVTVGVAIAQSWPKHKRIAAERGALFPTGKPDLDNIVKLVADALNGIVWLDDRQIVDLVSTKRYVEIPATTIRVEQMQSAGCAHPE